MEEEARGGGGRSLVDWVEAAVVAMVEAAKVAAMEGGREEARVAGMVVEAMAAAVRAEVKVADWAAAVREGRRAPVQVLRCPQSVQRSRRPPSRGRIRQ